MADCDEINQALSRLSSKIDGFNNRLNALEKAQKECCRDKKGQNQSNPNQDLSSIISRLNKLERYCESVEQFIKGVSNFIVSLKNTFGL